MINIKTLFTNPERFNDCMDFVSAHFGNREFFEKLFADSIKSNDSLPQGYMLMKDKRIIGFCGLIEKELIQRDDLSPFISPLLIASEDRGVGLGAMLLKHVRKEAGWLGFFKVYLTTDHIGYYEKYGFKEIGLTQFTWGRPTKLYSIQSIGMPKLTEMLITKYPDSKVILLGGSFARNDGIDVQDIDVKIIVDDESNQNINEIFEFGKLVDLSMASAQTISDMDSLLSNAYDAGFYSEAVLLYDRDGGFDEYLAAFKEKFAQPQYLKNRVNEQKNNLNNQYHDVLSACENGDEIDIQCRFATYTWTLCDVILVRNLKSPSWIRGLQKVGCTDKSVMNKIITAEGHRYLEKQELITLLPLYSELWQGQFWDFLKSEIEWLICNNCEPQGFHSLNICFMMGVENNENRKELFNRWQAVTDKNKILPIKSIDEFNAFHQEMLDYLKI